MKRTRSIILTVLMCLSLCACGKTETHPEPTPAALEVPAVSSVPAVAIPAETEPDMEDFPYVGTWASPEGLIYLRIREDGTISGDSVIVSSGTHTVNGVTTSVNSKQVRENVYSFTWALVDGQFIFNGIKGFDSVYENGEYRLVSDGAEYIRVGGLDYQISLEDGAAEGSDIRELAQTYSLGTVIQGEGFELVLTEAGLADDIRVTSKTSGIQITSGPSAESGKQFVYAKGTLKNTGKTACRAVIGGTVYLDDYEFNLHADTIGTDGAPSSMIEPFETVHILLFAHVSDEMAGMFTDGKIVFGFNDNFTDVQVDQAQYLYCIPVSK